MAQTITVHPVDFRNGSPSVSRESRCCIPILITAFTHFRLKRIRKASRSSPWRRQTRNAYGRGSAGEEDPVIVLTI
jgi:hypothetical protein